MTNTSKGHAEWLGDGGTPKLGPFGSASKWEMQLGRHRMTLTFGLSVILALFLPVSHVCLYMYMCACSRISRSWHVWLTSLCG